MPTADHEGQTHPGGLRFGLAIAAVLVLAGAIRLYPLGADEYWLDELHSMANSAGTRPEFEAFPYGVIFNERPRATDLNEQSTLAAVWSTMRNDTHPPLYFLLLNGWRRLSGDSETAVRALPAIFSVLSIVPVALVFRRLKRPDVGVFAAMLLAVSFAHVQMAQQTRQYSLALMLTACSYLALIVAEDCCPAPTPRQRGHEAVRSARCSRGRCMPLRCAFVF